jgi:hypothetical protein
VLYNKERDMSDGGEHFHDDLQLIVVQLLLWNVTDEYINLPK